MSAPLHLVSSRGIPGTAGPVVRDGDTTFLLCNHHVIFGGGARSGDPVFALPEDGWGDRILVGYTARGYLGRVTYGREIVFVDCALIELIADVPQNAAGTASVEIGQLVRKHGAATGITEGRIVDTTYADIQFLDGQLAQAPGQLLVSSADPVLNFCSRGDSGAAIYDHRGRVVGLLWGWNASGQGVACPIGPVLDCLGVILGESEGGIHGGR